MKKRIVEIFLFAIAGGLGFIVDSILLYIFLDFLGLYFSRVVSFLGAVIVTWLFNRFFTFKSCSSGHSLLGEFLKYLSLMGVGGVINIVSYMVCIRAFVLVSSYPVIGVAIGSIMGMFFNYATSKIFLFKNKPV
jgi:Predicted membrane protein